MRLHQISHVVDDFVQHCGESATLGEERTKGYCGPTYCSICQLFEHIAVCVGYSEVQHPTFNGANTHNRNRAKTVAP